MYKFIKPQRHEMRLWVSLRVRGFLLGCLQEVCRGPKCWIFGKDQCCKYLHLLIKNSVFSELCGSIYGVVFCNWVLNWECMFYNIWCCEIIVYELNAKLLKTEYLESSVESWCEWVFVLNVIESTILGMELKPVYKFWYFFGNPLSIVKDW